MQYLSPTVKEPCSKYLNGNSRQNITKKAKEVLDRQTDKQTDTRTAVIQKHK